MAIIISKKLTFICLAVLVCMFLAKEENAVQINNRAIQGNLTTRCHQMHPKECNKQQANDYQRGCQDDTHACVRARTYIYIYIHIGLMKTKC
ncbi:hypothetical protein P3X46_018072 [Hevea brasiliensis]|uniref:Uncharacterized protein n=1 Tax=Hevea brasiliensis TaxID=3981 RepID=A0ABQ9LSS6_HEVBR|nr:hypothetical protein P3X46_018072 [Hevea brasiliensis]